MFETIPQDRITHPWPGVHAVARELPFAAGHPPLSDENYCPDNAHLEIGPLSMEQCIEFLEAFRCYGQRAEEIKWKTAENGAIGQLTVFGVSIHIIDWVSWWLYPGARGIERYLGMLGDSRFPDIVKEHVPVATAEAGYVLIIHRKDFAGNFGGTELHGRFSSDIVEEVKRRAEQRDDVQRVVVEEADAYQTRVESEPDSARHAYFGRGMTHDFGDPLDVMQCRLVTRVEDV